MTPPGQYGYPSVRNFPKMTVLAPILAGCMSNLVGGVMTPPYEMVHP